MDKLEIVAPEGQYAASIHSDMLTLLSTKDISKSGQAIVPFNVETVRRYFNRGIFFTHEIGDDSVSQMTYKGSAIVRYNTLRELRRDRSWRKMSLEALGRAFKSAGGPQDEFIVAKIKQGVSVDEISASFKAAIEKAAIR